MLQNPAYRDDESLDPLISLACLDSSAYFECALGKKLLDAMAKRTYHQNAELVWNLTQDNLQRMTGKIN